MGFLDGLMQGGTGQETGPIAYGGQDDTTDIATSLKALDNIAQPSSGGRRRRRSLKRPKRRSRSHKKSHRRRKHYGGKSQSQQEQEEQEQEEQEEENQQQENKQREEEEEEDELNGGRRRRKGRRGKKTRGKTSAWIKHVLHYAKSHKMKYFQALKDKKCRSTYKSGKK